jgi:hypothetical protein
MAVSFQNRLVRLQDDLLKIRAEQVLPTLSEPDRERYRSLEKEKVDRYKNALQDNMPQSSQEIEKKVSQYARQILTLEEELHRASIRMKTLHDQLDTIVTYYLKNAPRTGGVDQRIVEKVEQEKKRTLELSGQLAVYKSETEEEKNQLLLGGDMLSKMIIARDAYGKIIMEQGQIQKERIGQIAGRIGALSKQVEGFNAKLNEVVGGIIQNIKDSFENEKMKVEEYKSQLLSLKRETAETASLAMYTNIAKVNSTFDDLVLQADLGIIDVAWEKKEEATQNLNKLRTRMAREIQELYLNLENLE